MSDWKPFYAKTHLGEILKDGAIALGFDLTTMNAVQEKGFKNIPDVVLVKRQYEKKSKRKRVFKLKRMEIEGAGEGIEEEDGKKKKVVKKPTKY